MDVPVHSASDPRLDDYRNIPDHELLERRGIFIAEGRMVVRRLLTRSRFAARSVMVTGAARHALADELDAGNRMPVYVVPQALMDGVAGFNIHRGCLAVGERAQPAHWEAVVQEAQTILVLERMANADNVGALFRSAAAFGAGAVLLDAVSTDPLYRKAIRTSMGAALQVPFARAEPWPAALDALRSAGFTLVGLTPTAVPTLAATSAALAGRRVALLLGHEGDGLSEPALASCDLLARIPMAPGVDSVNVATAGAIALYEFSRERGLYSTR